MAVNTVLTQNNINTDIPVEVIYGGTGAITHTEHGILLGNGDNPITSSAALSDGQLLIGSTGNAPAAATLTAGYGISITNAAGAITIDTTGQSPVEKVTASEEMEANTSYITNGVTSLVMTLPETVALGTVFTVVDMGEGFRIAQNAGQQITFGTKQTTSGTSGNIETIQDGSSLTLMCTTADVGFHVISSVGNFVMNAA